MNLMPMETQKITPACVESRGGQGAWEEAVARLREIYDVQLKHNPTAMFALTISRTMDDGNLRMNEKEEK